MVLKSSYSIPRFLITLKIIFRFTVIVLAAIIKYIFKHNTNKIFRLDLSLRLVNRIENTKKKWTMMLLSLYKMRLNNTSEFLYMLINRINKILKPIL